LKLNIAWKIKMKKILFGILLLTSIQLKAQDSTKTQTNALGFGGYAEAYYSYDFNKPADNNRPSFLYSHNRHNEFNVNLAHVKGSYKADRIRANVALAVGTYINANYAAEPGVLKNVYEANVGVKISKAKNLWIDAGIFSSHIGFESAQSSGCWSLTRSMVAENSPYFESGAKLSYTSDNGKISLTALALNGWQRITRVNGNSLMSCGTQIFVKPSDKITFNYSTFFGTDKPDSSRLWRIYHNLYAIFQFNDKIGLTTGFDIGTEQVSKGSNDKNIWYTPVGILRFTPNSNWAIAVRGEYFSDGNGVIISTGTPNGFKTFGASLNFDRTFGEHLLWRTEFRTFSSKDAIFIKENTTKKNDGAITTSLALTF
jgi:Putative beta-barrel porin-2, OmpL-like. bbp2